MCSSFVTNSNCFYKVAVSLHTASSKACQCFHFKQPKTDMQCHLNEIFTLTFCDECHTEKKFFFFFLACELVWWLRAKELPARSDSLSSIPRVHMVERTNSQNLSSTSTCPLWHTLAYKINKQT